MQARTDDFEDREGAMRLSHRLVALHVCGVILLIMVVLSSVLWISAEHNKLARDSSETVVRAGVDAFRQRLRTLVIDYSVWDEAYDAIGLDDRDWLYRNIGNAAEEIGTLDLIVFVPPDGDAFGWELGSPVKGEANPLPPSLTDAIVGLLVERSDGAGAEQTLLAQFRGEPWAFSAARVVPVAGAPADVPEAALPIQIHGMRMSGERLTEIGADPIVGELVLAPLPQGRQASVPLIDYAGNVIEFLVWDPPRPAGSILRRVGLPLTLALLAVALISAISSSYAVRQARRLERALLAAKAADRSKTEFLSNVSHELRTPMNGILGVAQLLRTTPLDAEQEELVSVLFASAEAQMALISDLLDISRVESGNRQLVSEPFEPKRVLKELTDLIRVAAAKKGIAFASNWNTLEDVRVMGDERAFRQIVTNFLGNAVKFTETGGVELRSRVTLDEGRVRCVVEVVDTGRGIPEEALPRIFDRFYQVDGSLTRGIEGTGLGLAISQSLARMMGGRIEVESEDGVGSTFRLVVGFNSADQTSEALDAA